VLFMILVHALGHYGNEASWLTPVGGVLVFLGGPAAAPVFMVLMGASLAFSRRSSPGAIARRGLWLLALAYTLNVLRGALPATLGLTTGFVTEADIAPYTPAVLLGLVDIHQMAGLSLLGIAALVLVAGGRDVRWAAVALAVAAALVAPALWGATTGQPVVDTVLALLWGSDWNVFFPLLSWIAYPLIGFAIGRILVERPDRRRMVRLGGIAGLALGLLGLAAIVLTGEIVDVEDYWRQGPAIVLAILGFVLVWLAGCDLVVDRLPGFLRAPLFGWSARVTSMYCIHWILIGWGVGLLGHRQLDLPALVVVMVALVALTDRITVWLPFLRGPGSRNRQRDAARAATPGPGTAASSASPAT
jgi:uncharacterized membrane protein